MNNINVTQKLVSIHMLLIPKQNKIMRYSHVFLCLACVSLLSCSKFDINWLNNHKKDNNEDASKFSEIASIDIGDAGAAEISAYDPKTKRLFVVNNGTTNKIDVISLENITALTVIASIDVLPYGGLVNSVAVSDELLAAAIESINKQMPGKVVVFKTTDYSVVKIIPVGALPDMVTFSPDGKYIVTANEGEPSTDYLVDPLGTISVISVKENFSVVNIDFSSFANQQATLQAKACECLDQEPVLRRTWNLNMLRFPMIRVLPGQPYRKTMLLPKLIYGQNLLPIFFLLDSRIIT